MKKTKVYLYNYNHVSLYDPGPDVEYKELDRVFYAELKLAYIDYPGNFILMVPLDADDYIYLDTHRPLEAEQWREWTREWERLYNQTMKYKVKVWKDLRPVVLNMVGGIISGWWKWIFTGGVASISYLGKTKPNEG